jgi:DNA-directed RNA polymerase specialized sigma subunit
VLRRLPRGIVGRADPDGAYVSEGIACDSVEFEGVEYRDVLVHALAHLSERERLIVRLRFVEERTQTEIGRVLGVSQMQVSRLLAGILRGCEQGSMRPPPDLEESW